MEQKINASTLILACGDITKESTDAIIIASVMSYSKAT
jgi:hypothetical protein